MRMAHRWISAIAASLLISACQAIPAGHVSGPTFVLGLSGAASDGPLDPSIQAPQGTGVLTVQLSGFLAALKQRRVLATVADIDYVVVTVRQMGFPDHTVTVPKSELSGGQASATFTGLVPSAATVILTAFDAAGNAIGSSMQAVTITADTVTPVVMTVQLDPTPATPSPSGGGSSGAGTGGVAVTGTFVDGPTGSPTPAAPGTVLASFVAWHNAGFISTGDHKIYTIQVMGLGQPSGMYSVLTEVSTLDGTPVWSQGLGGQAPGNLNPIHGPYLYDKAHDVLWYGVVQGDTITRDDTGGRIARISTRAGKAFAVDAAGFAYCPQQNIFSQEINQPAVFSYVLERKAPDATSTTVEIPTYGTVAFDTTGRLWAGWVPTPANSAVPQSSVRRYTAAGDLIDTLSLPFVPQWMQPDGSGGMWVSDAPQHGTQLALAPDLAASRQLLKVQADGTVGTPFTLPLDDFCVMPDGNLWVAGGTSATKLAADGTTLLTVPVQASFISYGDGIVYAGNGQTITKLAP